MKRLLAVAVFIAVFLGMASQAFAWTVRVRNNTSHRIKVWVSVVKLGKVDKYSIYIEPKAHRIWSLRGWCPNAFGGYVYPWGTNIPRTLRMSNCVGNWIKKPVIPCCWNIRLRVKRVANRGKGSVVVNDDYGFVRD